MSLCLCGTYVPQRTRMRLLVLQHPREAKNPISTARLASLNVRNSVHRVGLSWASLARALGGSALPNEWAVLYVGTRGQSTRKTEQPFQLVDRQDKGVSVGKIRGLIILDGNWKQSKTLWWRNPWLTRVNRLILYPEAASVYGQVRQQPRGYCLSSLEATAFALSALGESRRVNEALLGVMNSFMERLNTCELPTSPEMETAAPTALP